MKKILATLIVVIAVIILQVVAPPQIPVMQNEPAIEWGPAVEADQDKTVQHVQSLPMPPQIPFIPPEYYEIVPEIPPTDPGIPYEQDIVKHKHPWSKEGRPDRFLDRQERKRIPEHHREKVGQ